MSIGGGSVAGDGLVWLYACREVDHVLLLRCFGMNFMGNFPTISGIFGGNSWLGSRDGGSGSLLKVAMWLEVTFAGRTDVGKMAVFAAKLVLRTGSG